MLTLESIEEYLIKLKQQIIIKMQLDFNQAINTLIINKSNRLTTIPTILSLNNKIMFKCNKM